MAMARAAPSTGSVPAPSSSKRIRLCPSASSRILTMFTMWAEKVERLCSMLCSSPMSASTRSKTLTALRSSAGMCRPHWAMRVSRPRVLRLTVLPPVLGPVMTRVSNFCPSSMVMGTALPVSSRGCRAWRRQMLPFLRISGRVAFIL
jgi:hypothetical protein